MMKHRHIVWFTLVTGAALLVAVWFAMRSPGNTPMPDSLSLSTHSGTAVVITGAAARIAQESALLEKLHKSGWLNNVRFISGTSSGALNAVVLNAILSGQFSWSRLRNLYASIDNDRVFVQTRKKVPLNTEPLKELLTQILRDTLKYNSLGSLPFPTSFSVTDIQAIQLRTQTYRLCNLRINEESDPSINLIEALMATTAIPVLFPPAKITSSTNLPKSSFVDGGLAEDHIPYMAVLQFEKFTHTGVDTLIIVSRKGETDPKILNEFNTMGVENNRVYNNLGFRIENYTRAGFIKCMKELQQHQPGLAARTFVYIPDFEEYYPLLDFRNMALQYDVTVKWAETNQPIPLLDYLARVEEP